MPVVESASGLLREARRRAGLTQEQLALRARVTQSVISAYESGRRQPSVPVLLRLIGATGHRLEASLIADDAVHPVAMSGPLGRRVSRHHQEVNDVAAAHGARNVRVFGSVARGTERVDSDVDLLVDLPPGTGLFALGRLRRELEELLQAKVDVVAADGLKPEIRAKVESELVAL